MFVINIKMKKVKYIRTRKQIFGNVMDLFVRFIVIIQT